MCGCAALPAHKQPIFLLILSSFILPFSGRQFISGEWCHGVAEMYFLLNQIFQTPLLLMR